MGFSYDAWIDEQAQSIEGAMHFYGSRGIFGAVAVYVIPSKGSVPGMLIASDKQVEGATDVVCFPGRGTRVMAIPYPHLRGVLWHACRSYPIVPVTEAV